MRFMQWMLGGLVCVLAGCEATQVETPEAPETPGVAARTRAEQLAEARGFNLREATLVEAPGGKGDRHRLHLQGVPVLGLEARTAHGETHFTNVRLAPGVRVETKPQLTQEQAVSAVLAELKDPSAKLTGARLMLLPHEEHRRKPDAPASARPNAAHFERVVTGMTLIYRLELSTGEGGPDSAHTWMAQVDARSGKVLRLDPLALDADDFRTVTGRGYFNGTRTFLTLFNAADGTYDLQDTHKNQYLATFPQGGGAYSYALYYSEDASFGDGLKFLASSQPDSVNGETAAVDAFHAVNTTWTVFDAILLRNGPSGMGRPLSVNLHYPMYGAQYLPHRTKPRLQVGYSSALAPPTLRRIPMATTDIVGHEIGHDFFGTAVWEDPADTDLSYSEMAAMNEATGDIIGFLAELTRDAMRAGGLPSSIDQMTPQPSHFSMGEETGTVARDIRSPVHYEWYDKLRLEGPHAAAGPITRMFVLLAYGCQPMPDSGPYTEQHCPLVPKGFSGIGPVKAARIWASTVEALPDGGDFHLARELALEAAWIVDPLHMGSHKKVVASAFAAVGVGDPPDLTPPTTTLTCHQVDLDIECTGTVSDPLYPDQFNKPPQIVVDGTGVYTLPGWQFTQRISGTSLASGNHSLQLRAWDWWDNLATRTVTVNLDKTGPQATLSRFGPPKQPLLSVLATDPSGILQVEFLKGAQLMDTLFASPYDKTFDTSTWTDGTHPMVARVYDEYGNVTVLNHALPVDNTRPVLTLTVGTSGPPFNLSATATDASALVRADFKVDGLVFATRNTGSPYQASYSPSDPLVHTLTVEVTDAFGNKATATQTAPQDRVAPAVTFSAQQGYTGTMTLTVGTSDSCGIQYPYALYVDGILVGQPTTPGYVVLLASSAVSVGVHAFHAVVSDNCGNTTQYATTFTKVYTPPAISAVARDDSQPKQPKFTVQCNDTEGVHHVEMRENGAVLQTDNTPPYQFAVDTSARADGNYTVLFQCFDVYGAWSSPETRTVIADNTPPGILFFSVYGSGHTYQVSANAVSDPRGVKSVVLQGGLLFPPTFRVTLTQGPWFYNFFFDTSISLDTQFMFGIMATDLWGNERTEIYLCHLDTETTQHAYLPCVLSQTYLQGFNFY